jgi:hypothetical protein
MQSVFRNLNCDLVNEVQGEIIVSEPQLPGQMVFWVTFSVPVPECVADSLHTATGYQICQDNTSMRSKYIQCKLMFLSTLASIILPGL